MGARDDGVLAEGDAAAAVAAEVGHDGALLVAADVVGGAAGGGCAGGGGGDLVLFAGHVSFRRGVVVVTSVDERARNVVMEIV